MSQGDLALKTGIRVAEALRGVLPHPHAWVLCYLDTDGSPSSATTLRLDLAIDLLGHVHQSFARGSDVELLRVKIPTAP